MTIYCRCMISQNEIDELCSHILHTDIWKQKVTDWLTHDGVFSETTDHTNQEVFSQLSSNEELASEIIKCTLTQVNEDQWTVDIWKQKLKKQGKSFDLTPSTALIFEVRLNEKNLQNLPRRNTKKGTGTKGRPVSWV